MILRLPYPDGGGTPPVTGNMWDETSQTPSNTTSRILVSNNGRDISHPTSGGWFDIRSTQSKTTGRFYAEHKKISSASQNAIIIGVSNINQNMADYPGSSGDAVGFWDNNGGNGRFLGGSGASEAASPWADGVTACLDMDIDNKQWRVRLNNGSWTGWSVWSFTGAVYQICGMHTGPAEVLSAWSAANCAFPLPSGAQYWNS